MTLDPARLTVDIDFGGLTLTFLSPTREQRARADAIREKFESGDVDPDEGRRMFGEIEALLLEVLHQGRRGEHVIEQTPIREAAREYGYLRQADGLEVFLEVYFRRWTALSRLNRGGTGRADQGSEDRGGAGEG